MDAAMQTGPAAGGPLILDIKGNSLDDGPGIRSVVFFKGCPLSCVWCHNPESRKAGPELSFDANVCVGCGDCRTVCPTGALSRDLPGQIRRELCRLCFACADVCPSGALTRVGQVLSVDDIMARVLPDLPFFKVGGGGVTVSGGEATLHMDFLHDLLSALKSQGIHTLLETCGQFDLARFMDRIYPLIDTIYYDIKIMDPRAHKRFCGVLNDRILANFKALAERARADQKDLLSRTPLVPGITDTDDNLFAVAAFLKAQGIGRTALLDYNPLWHDKIDTLGAKDPYKHDTALSSFADRTVRRRCQKIFDEAGIDVA
ncbi:glycyl-radical enzyme activating protein [Desulfatiferula olefinivorans]